MSAKYKSPSFLLPNELNTSANTATGTGVNSLYSMDFRPSQSAYIDLGDISLTGGFTVSFWMKPDAFNGVVIGDSANANSFMNQFMHVGPCPSMNAHHT